MSILSRLSAAGCRVDGVQLLADGSIGFATTNGGGAWTDNQKNAVLGALGKLPVVLTPEQQEAQWAGVIQAWLDSTAQTFGYNNLAYAVSYVDSSVDLWKRQGAAFTSWRDTVWTAAFTLLAAILGGTAQPPANNAALLAQLPQPSIPES